MLEGELELAICIAYDELLPDLARAGYELLYRQARLHGRRIDLLLRRQSDSHHCIIELKTGNPRMPAIGNQLLDYARCWQLSYPAQRPPRLIAIGTSLRDETRSRLRALGIEARAITAEQAFHALDRKTAHNQRVKHGVELRMSYTQRVRERLSNHQLLVVPEGLTLGAPWDHQKVCLALAHRGER